MASIEKSAVTVIGAGPAGAITSLFLSKYKIHHTILEKAVFPRDKICGDGLSGKVVSVLKKLDAGIINELKGRPDEFLPSWGVVFIAPNGKKLEIPFKKDLSHEPHPPGFVSKRIHFDRFLADKINTPYATLLTDAEVTGLVRNQHGISVHYHYQGQNQEFTSRLVIGSDGDRSIASKTFFNYSLEPEHLYAGIRGYYKGISQTHPLNFIELHFIRELLPGYFWIFPLPDGYANVGVCVLSSSISKSKINLRETMQQVIEKHPEIRQRFSNATAVSQVQGWRLPLGSAKRTFSKDHVLLTGDAASLIDPFTGEGIGNAIYSGMLAAGAAKKAMESDTFTEEFLKLHYDGEIEAALRAELKLSYKMQRLCRQPWLFNFVASRSEKNPTLKETISCMFEDLDLRAKLRDPKYYLKLLFNY